MNSVTSTIEARRLGKTVYERQIINGLDLRVEAGEVVWIEGTSGCGKSLLCNLLSGVESVDQGEILWASHHGRAFGVVFDTPAIISNLSIEQNMSLVLDHFLGTQPDREKRRQEIIKLLRPWQLEETLDWRPVALSRSQQVALALVRALVATPRVLIWDDAFDAFGPKDQDFVAQALLQARAQGTALLCLSRRPPLNLLPQVRHLQLHHGRLSA